MLGVDLSEDFRERLRTPKRVAVHAYGLVHPGHMEWTQDGRLLVSEFGAGRVQDITEGGDCRDRTPFASGLGNPAGIVTAYEGATILVADTGRSQVVDISHGGNVSERAAIMSDVPSVYGLTLFDGKLFGVFSTESQNGVARLSAWSGLTDDAVHFGGFPNANPDHPPYLPDSVAACPSNWKTVAFNGRMLYVHSGLGALYDVSSPGRFSYDTPKFLHGLSRPLGMIHNPKHGLLYIADRGTGSVKAAPADGGVNMRFVPPVVSGFKNPSCIRFGPSGDEMYVCDTDDATVWRVEF